MKTRKYMVIGHNADSHTTWIAGQDLYAAEAHDMAANLRNRFPADTYTAKIQQWANSGDDMKCNHVFVAINEQSICKHCNIDFATVARQRYSE